MATFTILEINNDHLADLVDGDEEDPKNYLAGVLQAISRNPEGNGQRMIESCELHRVLRVICQNGNPITSTTKEHLWRNPTVAYVKPGNGYAEMELMLLQALGDLEQLNMALSSSPLAGACAKLRTIIRYLDCQRTK
jgi:hypothetical protein